MLYSRFLLPQNLVENAVITPLSDDPMRRYLGTNPERLGLNLHPIIAHYFERLVFDVLPDGIPDDLWSALRLSAFYRALYGFGVVAQQAGRHVAIDPRFWWPVLVRGVKVGSIIVQPYRVDPGNAGALVTVPDRAIVMIAIDADPRVEIRIVEWSGVTLGRTIETSVLSPLKIGVWGCGVSDFTMAGLWSIDEFSARTAGISGVLKRFENPHIQAPVSAIRYDDAGNPQLSVSASGSVLPVQNNDKDWKYLTLEKDSPLHKFELDMILRTISANTSIPASVFGLSNSHPRAESGDAIMADNHVTNARLRSMQTEIQIAVAEMGYDLMWPSETETEEGSDNG